MKYTISIEQDLEPLNPREEFDNLGTMACEHPKYNLGDSNLQGREPSKGNISLPLYLYDHGGITISTTPFSCKWDSSRVGTIFVSKEKIYKEYGVKRISKTLRRKVIDILRAEIKIYDDYLTGNVWGYVIKNENNEEVDSCWGFFGDKEYCMEDAKASLCTL